MKRIRNLSVTLALAALVVAGLLVLPASAATTTGTWSQYPTGATEYQAEVQQPINTANTSNWNSKSKGAIPVMFKLCPHRARRLRVDRSTRPPTTTSRTRASRPTPAQA